MRLTKDNDLLSDEFEKLKEKNEIAQNAVMKVQREKEVIQTEFEMVKERWDKTHSIHQKLQVWFSKFSEFAEIILMNLILFRWNEMMHTLKSISWKKS